MSPLHRNPNSDDSDFSVKIGVIGIRNSDQIKRYVLEFPAFRVSATQIVLQCIWCGIQASANFANARLVTSYMAGCLRLALASELDINVLLTLE